MLNDGIKTYEESKDNLGKKIEYSIPAKYKKEYEFCSEPIFLDTYFNC